MVLAVVLATALLGASLPTAERAERDRNAAVATEELAALADRADRLAANNDPIRRDEAPAAATLTLRLPEPTLTDGGRIVVADDRLVWAPEKGPNRTVEATVPIRTEAPIELTASGRLHLALYRIDDRTVVTVSRARVEKESRDQPSYALGTARHRKPL